MRASAVRCQPAHCAQALSGRAIKTTTAARRVISDRTVLECRSSGQESNGAGLVPSFVGAIDSEAVDHSHDVHQRAALIKGGPLTARETAQISRQNARR